MRIVLASGNAGKLRELAGLLAPRGFDLVLQSQLGIEPAEETGDTFEANALLKARHAARLAGLPALADDSGLEVDALGGRPGVRSARYAGDAATDGENLALLLRELEGLPKGQRGARFRCAIAFVRDAEDPAPVIATGAWEGRIARTPCGSGGFGYDPVFIPADQGGAEADITAAEMSADEKNAVSHRGMALRRLLELLP